MRNPLCDTISTKNQNKTLSRNQVSAYIYRFSQRIFFFAFFFSLFTFVWIIRIATFRLKADWKRR